MPADLPQPYCTGCNKTPEEISEYVDMGIAEEMTPTEFVWDQEGTLNRRNGHFLCTSCYLGAGQPSARGGWTAP
jgi:hypothetical protein